MKGIAEGLHAEGSKIDLWDIVALNGVPRDCATTTCRR